MGAEKVTVIKDAKSRHEFMAHLLNDVSALEFMLENNMFEKGKTRIGAEQELCIIDEASRPYPQVMKLLELIDDDHYTTEYLSFNLEINLDPLNFEKNCFNILEKDLLEKLIKAEKAANKINGHIIQVGILPTIHREDIVFENLTPLKRYRALTDKLQETRGSDFHYRIEGKDQLITKDKTTLFEGCNTSFQVHYQIDVSDFAAKYNLAQLLAGPVLALSGNSSLFLGKRLWHETRISLFHQAVDIRNSAESYRFKSPRVGLGQSWIKNSVLEYYQNEIIRHVPLLITNQKEDALGMLKEGAIPKLRALNVHNGTVYRWNRACYGITDGKPHIRIENRLLPSGPSPVDEIANAAFWLGLMHSDDTKFKNVSERISFDDAKENFYKAAKMGLDVSFNWFDNRKVPATILILNELLPLAEEGLKKANIDQADIDKYLGIIEKRVASGQTGASWMLKSFEEMTKSGKKQEAIVALTSSMSYLQRKNIPVSEWDLATLERGKDWKKRYFFVHQIMSTDLFTIHEDDLVELATKFMNWKYIRHIPVENTKKELVGIITSRNLLNNYSKTEIKKDLSIKDIMESDLITVGPKETTQNAIRIMKENEIGCLPVTKDKKLLGIITERDVLEFSNVVLQQMK
jgi:CBS domain-containing protein/gamma-glutamylcysteine synthetase